MLFLFAEEPADVGDSQAEFVFAVIFAASRFCVLYSLLSRQD